MHAPWKKQVPVPVAMAFTIDWCAICQQYLRWNGSLG